MSLTEPYKEQKSHLISELSVYKWYTLYIVAYLGKTMVHV